jgi:hypothetical protein
MPGRGICLKGSTVESPIQRTFAHEDSKAHALATVASAFGYEMAVGRLETTPDFGCSQFENKRSVT